MRQFPNRPHEVLRTRRITWFLRGFDGKIATPFKLSPTDPGDNTFPIYSYVRTQSLNIARTFDRFFAPLTDRFYVASFPVSVSYTFHRARARNSTYTNVYARAYIPLYVFVIFFISKIFRYLLRRVITRRTDFDGTFECLTINYCRVSAHVLQ